MSCCKNNGTFLTRSWDKDCCYGHSNNNKSCCNNNSSNNSCCSNNSSNNGCCNNNSSNNGCCNNNSSNNSCCNNYSNNYSCCDKYDSISCSNNNNDCCCEESLREVACKLTNQRVIIHVEGCKMCVVIVAIGKCFLKAINPCTQKVVYINLNRIDNIEDVLPRCYE